MVRNLTFILTIILMITSCQKPVRKESPVADAISNEAITATVTQVVEKYQLSETVLLEKGVRHAATLWRTEDGTTEDFRKILYRKLRC